MSIMDAVLRFDFKRHVCIKALVLLVNTSVAFFPNVN